MEEGFCSEIKYHPGLFNPKRPYDFIDYYDLPRLHVQIVSIFTLSHSIDFILQKLIRLPRIISEILAGMVLSPTFMGQIEDSGERLFPLKGGTLLDVLARMGLVFFIFLNGVKMDPAMVWRAGWSEWSVGLSGFWMTKGICNYFSQNYLKTMKSYNARMYAAVVFAQSYITVPMVASVLVHLEIMNTELGRFALSTALISDLSFTLWTVFFEINWASHYKELRGVTTQSIVLPLLLMILIISIVKPISCWIMRQTPEERQVKTTFITIMCIVLLAMIIVGDNVGVRYEICAFVVGLAIPHGPPLGSTIVEKMETLVHGFLAPLMASLCGTKVDLIHLYDLTFINRIWLIVVVCLLIKTLMVFIPAIIFRASLRDAFVLAFVMSYQGVIQLSNHFSFYASQVYDPEVMTMMVLSVLLISASMSSLAKLTYNYSLTYTSYGQRTIQHRAIDSELSLVSCIYRLHDIYDMKRLLEATIHDKKSTISVYVVNLVELVGRDIPQIIDHNFDQKARRSRCIRANELFEIFTTFRQKYIGLFDFQLFTAISMYKFMHQDIRSLAVRTSVSVIVLPFHLKWNNRGKISSDNSKIRKVNCNVLKRAPCSVGILVDRNKVQQQSRVVSAASTVGVVFIGGADDREALSYGRQMARSPGIQLTVVRLVVSTTYGHENQQDTILDEEALEDLKMACIFCNNIVYTTKMVKDGADTAFSVHSLVDVSDLILVGRRHSDDLPHLAGIVEWIQFPELGHIGDIMVTSEINKPLSILVLQQHDV